MKHPDIPILAYRLFKWFCKEEYFEELEGDLEERFMKKVEVHGLRKARRHYWKEVLHMIRPTIVKRQTLRFDYQLAMIGSYMILAFRNLKRHRLFSFINVFSLAVAMSAGLLVIGMVSDLMKFDEFHTQKEEIYRVISTPYYQERPYKTRATSPLPLGTELKEQVPGISLTQLGRRFGGESVVNQKKLEVSGIYADAHFFDFLSFDMISGKRNNVLKDPFSVVISKSLSKKVFDEVNPIGEPIEIDGLGIFNITGVVEDPPKFSHLQFDVIGSFSTVELLANKGVFNAGQMAWEKPDSFYNYLLIPEDQVAGVQRWLDQSAISFYKEPERVRFTFELQPLTAILPGPNISESIGPKMIMLPVIVLAVIAIAILLSAIFNYTNLSMALALRRTREVGVRKLNGAGSRSIFLQFLCEAVLLSLFSLGVGIILFMLLRPEFIKVIPRANEVLVLDLTPQLVGWFILFAVVTGLVSGLAPSVYFARLSSLKSLRASATLKSLSRINVRKGLIVAQFTVSIIFVMALAITWRLYAHVLNHDLGFNRENILNVTLDETDPTLLKSELLKLSEVSEVSFSSYVPGIGNWRSLRVVDERTMDSVLVHTMNIEETYIDNFDLELVAGRNFNEQENQHLEQSIIVNETFVRNFGLGLPAEAIGQVVQVKGNSVQIIGIIKDFHYAHLEEPINSFVFRNTGEYKFANVKLATDDLLSSYKRIEYVWDELDPINQMQAKFLDDQINEHYDVLVDIMKMFGFICFLAISISCLGLFGMTIYSTEIRLREIGIRKTFGASNKGLVLLLSKGFLKLVLFAIPIGVPLCFYVFDQFILEQYYYRFDISFVEVSLAVVSLLVLCLLTIGTQTWQAARTNPAKVLRAE